MSEHLKRARETWLSGQLTRAMGSILLHLEAQEQSQQAHQHLLSVAGVEYLTEEPLESAPSSSAVTPTEEATPPTLTISSSWHGDPLPLALTASQAETLSQFLPVDTWAYCSLHLTHGPEQAEATGAIRISKDSILPAGSASPSAEAARPEASGAAGECLHEMFIERWIWDEPPRWPLRIRAQCSKCGKYEYFVRSASP